MDAAEMAAWDAYMERTQPTWDEAFDAARYADDGDVVDTPAAVLLLAPEAPHVDRLPRHQDYGPHKVCAHCEVLRQLAEALADA